MDTRAFKPQAAFQAAFCFVGTERMPTLTAERLRQRLHYDPETGGFTHLCERRAGQPAPGRPDQKGYLQHTIQGGTYRAHRLAWLYVHGEWPKGEVDHLNGVRVDNRISNLRDVSRTVNAQNQRLPRANNVCGLLGVITSDAKARPYRTCLSINGKPKYFGNFATAQEAHERYIEVKRRLHPGCTI